MGYVMKKTVPEGKRCVRLYHAAYAWMFLSPLAYLLASWAKWEPGGWLYSLSLIPACVTVWKAWLLYQKLPEKERPQLSIKRRGCRFCFHWSRWPLFWSERNDYAIRMAGYISAVPAGGG